MKLVWYVEELLKKLMLLPLSDFVLFSPTRAKFFVQGCDFVFLFDNDMIWYSKSFVVAQHVFRLHVWSIHLIIFMSASHDFCFYHSSCQQSCVGSIYFAKKLCQLALVAMDLFFMKIGLRTLLFRLPTQCTPARTLFISGLKSRVLKLPFFT